MREKAPLGSNRIKKVSNCENLQQNVCVSALTFKSFVPFDAGFRLCSREQDSANLLAGIALCEYKVRLFYVYYTDILILVLSKPSLM